MAIHEETVAATFEAMKRKLSHLVPEIELQYKAELAFEINRLKRERGALILGHNYMEPALFHSVPDFVGDSLELSRRAATTTCDPIIFCGVRFMAETAKILNPTRTVLLPAKRAGCSLAESLTAQDVRALRERFPGLPVVVYINTYADVKAEADICCTSGNAAALVASLKEPRIIFLPDEYLARNVAAETGKEIVLPRKLPDGSIEALDISSAQIVGWHGRCEVHERFTTQDIEQARAQFPGLLVLAHPECSPEVVAASDFSSSTSKMTDFVKKSPAPHFLILTECSMGDNIIAENPEKDIVRMCNIRCPHMNEITLEDILHALRHDEVAIEIPETIRVRAKRSLDRMLEIH